MPALPEVPPLNRRPAPEPDAVVEAPGAAEVPVARKTDDESLCCRAHNRPNSRSWPHSLLSVDALARLSELLSIYTIKWIYNKLLKPRPQGVFFLLCLWVTSHRAFAILSRVMVGMIKIETKHVRAMIANKRFVFFIFS